MEKYRQSVLNFVDGIADEIIELSRKIHDNPEIGFEEVRAVSWQKELLEKYGFTVETPFCGLETAYKATFEGNFEKPCVAFPAEYDALKEIGHGCGHNIIAASCVGAGLALSRITKKIGGSVCVLGTPAEEFGGGKAIMAERHAFDGIDFAMSIHPRYESIVCRPQLYASVVFTVSFRGKAAHASKPHEGIDVVRPVISLFNGVEELKKEVPPGTMINGVILSCGHASNIIADFAECEFLVLADTGSEVKRILDAFRDLTQRAALTVGAEVTLTNNPVYAETWLNRAMEERFKLNMESLGEAMAYGNPAEKSGYSDVGNVSRLIPTIHEYIKIGDAPTHTEAFRDAAASRRADEVVVLAAKGMALTALDLIVDEALRKEVLEEFEKVANAS